jgi:hypothetical protein
MTSKTSASVTRNISHVEVTHHVCRYLASMRADMQRLEELEQERQRQLRQQQVHVVLRAANHTRRHASSLGV